MPLRFRGWAASLTFAVLLATAQAAPLRVGIETNNEPLSFVLPDGRPAGFVVELVEAIGREMNQPVAVQAGPWDQVFRGFKAGELDVLASLVYSPERDAFIDFSVSHLALRGELFVRRGAKPPRTLDELRKLRIGVSRGGYTQDYLTSQGLDGHFVFEKSLGQALQMLNDGECDAVAANGLFGRSIVRRDRLDDVVPASLVLPDFAYPYHFGVREGDAARLAQLNEGLARLRANGTYDQLYEKWIGPLEPRRIRWRDLRPFFLPAALVIAIALGVLWWQRRLVRRLARQAAALRESEERLTLVLEGGEAGFWDWDLRTGRVERSERWATMLGYTLAEIPPTLEGATPLVHPDDRKTYADFRGLLNARQGTRSNIEVRMRTKSGEWRWILDRGKVVATAPDGAPLRMAGTHTDITDIKRTQEALARQESQFRFVYEHAPVGLSWMRQGLDETRLVNAAHQRITGVTADRSRTTANYVAATHPDDRAAQRALETQMNRGEISHFSVEKRYLHAGGKTVWALLSMHRSRDPVTGETQQVTTLVDLSERKHVEAEREQLNRKLLDSQKLESLGVLAGGIAHDFNNLLTVVLANANLARTAPPGDADGAEALQRIEHSAQRAADLCRQLLAYAGKGSFVLSRVDLNQLARDTAQLLEISISKKAQLSLELAPDLPTVEADASQLQQVVMNLVINASDALGDSSGEIRVRTSRGRPQPSPGTRIHAFDLPPGDCACLEVSDTGHGMDAATLDRIFDPFFTTKFAGRGLGLAAVLGIIRARRGALTVASTPGQGTIFRLFLPAAANTKATPATNGANPVASARHAAAPTNALPILVADDEPSVRSTLDTLLRYLGHRTVLAADGPEALREFRARPEGFSAVLLDLTMPGLDGAEVLRAIRELNPAARVLVMSGYSEQDVIDRLRGLGEIRVLPKPFTHETLQARLNAVLAG